MRKINIDKTGVATFDCPYCTHSINRNVIDQIETQAKLTHRFVCPCGYSDTFMLNRRQHKRREINVNGLLLVDKTLTTALVTIVDVSRSGMGLNVESSKSITVGDTLTVSFFLKGDKSFHKKELIVKRKHGTFIGGEFISEDHLKTDKITMFSHVLKTLQPMKHITFGYGLGDSYYKDIRLHNHHENPMPAVDEPSRSWSL